MFRPSAVTVNQPSLMLTGLLALGVAGCGGSGEDTVGDWTQYDSPQHPFSISYPAHWVPASSERLTRVALLRAAPNGTEITSDSKFFAVYEVGTTAAMNSASYIVPTISCTTCAFLAT